MSSYRVEKYRERVLLWIAWRLPRAVAYWAAVRVMVEGYDENPAERPIVDALNDWTDTRRLDEASAKG